MFGKEGVGAMKTITFSYLAGYLLLSGVGLAFFPRETLWLLQSTGDYGDIMPRAVGMFMIMLGSLIASMTARRDYSYYLRAIQVRLFAIAFLFFLFIRSDDPLFLVMLAVVLIGWVPSVVTVLRDRARGVAQVGRT